MGLGIALSVFLPYLGYSISTGPDNKKATDGSSSVHWHERQSPEVFGTLEDDVQRQGTPNTPNNKVLV